MDDKAGYDTKRGLDVEAAMKAQAQRPFPERGSINRIGDYGCEMTVGESLDNKISEAERHAAALRDLKASLPGSFLSSGFSRIAFLKLGL